jgi:hypothetical protein
VSCRPPTPPCVPLGEIGAGQTRVPPQRRRCTGQCTDNTRLSVNCYTVRGSMAALRSTGLPTFNTARVTPRFHLNGRFWSMTSQPQPIRSPVVDDAHSGDAVGMVAFLRGGRRG